MRDTLRQLIARFRSLFRGGADDHDFAEELSSHLEMATEDNIRRGMAPGEARRQAAIALGMTSSLQQRHRDIRGFRGLDNLLQDIRFAWRLLSRDKWFSAAAAAAIALGIGANTVGFTVINAAFIRPFAFERAEELHHISWRPTRGRRLPSSAVDLEDWRAQSRSFQGIGASTVGAINISDDHAAPEQTQGASVTANLFDVLRQRPLLGRTFAAGEDRRGAVPVVIIGYDIWRIRFDRDPNVVGRILRINGQPATIVGVMPEGMKFPDNSELWVPYIPTDAELRRDARMLSVFGRLADGVAPEQADAEIDAIAGRILAAHPELTKSAIGGQVETLKERFLNGAAPRMFVVIMGAVVFVLLIACANVATLLLSRVMYRSREVAVRFALGATRWRIVRQLLIENVALSSLGGALGLALAWFGVRTFDSAIHATGAPYWLRFTIDYPVLFYVAAICVATGILFGLAPALQVSRENPHETLKDGARGATGNRRSGRLGNSLVVVELALTMVLLCGAGLMLRSFMALYAVQPGFEVNGLASMRMHLPPSNYPTADARLRFFDQLLSRASAIPGVQRAALTTAVPPLEQEEWRFEIDGREYGHDQPRPTTSTVLVTPGYFDVLGVAIARGRALTDADGTPGAERVVISHVMADRFFRGEDPVGRRVRFVPRDDEPALVPSWVTIVGVVEPFLQGRDDEAFKSPVVFLPLGAVPPRAASLIVRSPLPPVTVMTAVRTVVQSLDADQPVFAVETVAQVFADNRSIYGIFATLFVVLAVIGLVLSAVGVYGVMAYAVAQRTQEIGVRVAVGAGRWDVAWLFMRRGLLQLGLASALGLPAALAIGMLARFQLVQIEPTDPVTLIGVVVVLAVVALSSCLLPVTRAARVDPVVALRTE